MTFLKIGYKSCSLLHLFHRISYIQRHIILYMYARALMNSLMPNMHRYTKVCGIYRPQKKILHIDFLACQLLFLQKEPP
ncbi:hypothetical protein XENTR_v10003409 [Xenopus tropicalis]|nr:hypothetical protein XENTR_v10003409 [Xenopus tropicalis]